MQETGEDEPIIWKDTWISAQRMAKNNPTTFTAPTLGELEELGVEDLVKICNGYERFWVEIKHINQKNVRQKPTAWEFIGKVNNFLVAEVEYQFDDLVIFHGRHIYQIQLRSEFSNAIEKLIQEQPELYAKALEGDYQAVEELNYYEPNHKDN